MKDGGLRGIFRKQFPRWQWSSIESAGTVSGVPDSEFCAPGGIQGWIEFKQTHIKHVSIRPLQVSWIDRRSRLGGNVWIAVRRTPVSQQEAGADELWLLEGNQVLALQKGGLDFVHGVMWMGGPSMWNFDEVRNILLKI